jgi:hypothetical protein
MRILIPTLAALVAAPVLAEVANDDGFQHSFPVEQYDFTTAGNNQYWSLKPGTFVVLGVMDADGSEFVKITVLDETEVVDGVETRVVEEREFENGELVEISRNFFAMAAETGDIFYFGEDVDYFEDGEVVRHDGEWRAGVNNAKAGLYMPAEPKVGMKYYMEYDPSAAMDRAEINEIDAACEMPKQNFDDCLIITEGSPLEPGDMSYKRYAPDVGMIFDDDLEIWKYGKRRPSEYFVEFSIPEERMPRVPRDIVYELHPTGEIREVKVEIKRLRTVYAIETFIDGKQQWDVEVDDKGNVYRNKPD